jgi:Flp pilus assembly protein TadD
VKILATLFITLLSIHGVRAGEPIHRGFVEYANRQLTQLPLSERESHLRTMIAEFPGEAALHFRLGNLLAEQRRWPEARFAYAQANQLAPGHPDIHHNLAIALDHLEQFADASRHYRAALDAAARSQHRFHTAPLQQRLRKLEAYQP